LRVTSRGLGDVYKRQVPWGLVLWAQITLRFRIILTMRLNLWHPLQVYKTL
jgi:hypothetical protein